MTKAYFPLMLHICHGAAEDLFAPSFLVSGAQADRRAYCILNLPLTFY